MREAIRAKGSGWEIWMASLGCLLGSCLLILAVQLYQDSKTIFDKQAAPSNFFTLNKKIHGGALVNMGKGEKTFSQEELEEIPLRQVPPKEKPCDGQAQPWEAAERREMDAGSGTRGGDDGKYA